MVQKISREKLVKMVHSYDSGTMVNRTVVLPGTSGTGKIDIQVPDRQMVFNEPLTCSGWLTGGTAEEVYYRTMEYGPQLKGAPITKDNDEPRFIITEPLHPNAITTVDAPGYIASFVWSDAENKVYPFANYVVNEEGKLPDAILINPPWSTNVAIAAMKGVRAGPWQVVAYSQVSNHLPHVRFCLLKPRWTGHRVGTVDSSYYKSDTSFCYVTVTGSEREYECTSPLQNLGDLLPSGLRVVISPNDQSCNMEIIEAECFEA